MKQWLKNFKESQKGLALDEAILATAMVASLGVFVAINVPWSSYFSTSRQVMDELSRIEIANATFYERHRLWPHQTTTGDWSNNVAALVTKDAMRYPYSAMQSFGNVLEMPLVGRNNVFHSFGEGGRVLQRPVSMRGQDYLEIIFERVPLDEARRVDEKVDGSYTPDDGRVKLVYNDVDGVVNIHYRGNRI